MKIFNNFVSKVADAAFEKGYLDRVSSPTGPQGYGTGYNIDFGQINWVDRYSSSDDVYAVVNILIEPAATIPLEVQRMNNKGKPEVDTKHPVTVLLHQANAGQTFQEFEKLLYAYLMIEGEVFVHLERNSPVNSKDITALVAYSGMSVFFKERRSPEEYVLKLGPGDGVVIPAEDMVHIRLPNPSNPYRGLSPLSTLQIALDMEKAAKISNSRIFSEGLICDVAISVNAKNIDQIKKTEEMLEKYQNRRRPLLLWGESFDIQPLNVYPKDMQFIEMDQRTTEDVAKVYQVPLQMLSQSGENVLNLKIYRKMLYEDAVLPKVRLVTHALSSKLFNGDESYSLVMNLGGIEAFSDSEDEKLDRVAKLITMGADPDLAWLEIMGEEVPKGLFPKQV